MTDSGRAPSGQAGPSAPRAAKASRPSGDHPSRIWLTDEQPARRLVVLGTSAVDPDVWVAQFEDGSEGYKGKTLWVVKSSGYVVGIHRAGEGPRIYARPALAAGSRRAKTPKAVECEASQSGAKRNAQNQSASRLGEGL